MKGESVNQSFQSLVDEFSSYLCSHSYSIRRIKLTLASTKLLHEFMIKESLSSFNSDTCTLFIHSILRSREYESLNSIDKIHIRTASMLLELQITGMISFRKKKEYEELKGEIGLSINRYLKYRKDRNTSPDTIDSYRLYLTRLLDYLGSQKIVHLNDINQKTILGFVNSLCFFSKSTLHCTLCCLRVYLKYIYEQHEVNQNLSFMVPKDNFRSDAKVPSTYTKDEVDRLLKAIDRASPKGKRDYAMVLLACRLGLRASDICGLMFSNLNWDQSIIYLTQKKTKKEINLPLLQEIGNAIIDYLKHGRPISSLQFVFLQAIAPYKKLEEPTLHSIVSFYLQRAKIENCASKKHGPHALRHSLAGFLLEKKTPLPVISEILGHDNPESTNSYLRIDIQALRQCALEVPKFSTQCYEVR